MTLKEWLHSRYKYELQAVCRENNIPGYSSRDLNSLRALILEACESRPSLAGQIMGKTQESEPPPKIGEELAAITDPVPKRRIGKNVVWALGVLGSIASILGLVLVFAPALEPSPQVKITATSQGKGESLLLIENVGNTPVENLKVTIWATAVFSPKIDIIDVEHKGGVSDSDCKFKIVEARLTGGQGRANALNTVSKAALITDGLFEKGERWKGLVKYVEAEAVFGLLAHVRANGLSENIHVNFSKP